MDGLLEQVQYAQGNPSVEEAFANASQQITATVIEIQKYGNLVLSASGTEFLDDGYSIGDIINVTINGEVYEAPVGTNYSDVSQGSMVCRVLIDEDAGVDSTTLAIYMGDLATTIGIATKEEIGTDPGYVWHYTEGVAEPVSVSIEMKEKGGYNDQLLIHQLTGSINREDYPDLTDAEFANFRMIKMGDIPAGRLYRSSSPVNPDIGRNTYADAASKEAGIKTIINLADYEETMHSYEGFDKSYYSKQDIIALNLSLDFASDAFRSGFADGLRYLTTKEGPYLVHCHEGKDRSGFVCAVLECLMGGTKDEVIDDYMITFKNYYGVEPGTEKYDIIVNNSITKTLCTTFGLTTLDGVDLKSCAETYLLGIGLTQDEIVALKTKLSE